MAILNYTTTIAASKTVGEIQAALVKAGAEQVVIRYKDAQPTALVFELKGEMYMLPCRAEAVHKVLRSSRGVTAKYRTPEQAQSVAWRILKDWIEAQIAIIQTGMVEAQEVMLPYMIMQGDKTVYDSFVEQRSERLLEAK